MKTQNFPSYNVKQFSLNVRIKKASHRIEGGLKNLFDTSDDMIDFPGHSSLVSSKKQ